MSDLDYQIAAEEAKLIDEKIKAQETRLGSAPASTGMGIGKALNILPGLVRTAVEQSPLVSAIDIAQGHPQSLSQMGQAWKQAVSGEAKPLSQALSERGVPPLKLPIYINAQGETTSLPLRDILSVGGEMGLDLTNLVGGAALRGVQKAVRPGIEAAMAMPSVMSKLGVMPKIQEYISKLTSLLTPEGGAPQGAALGSVLEKLGKWIHSLPYFKYESAVTGSGPSISDIAFERGANAYSQKSAAKGLQDIIDMANAQNQEIASKASGLGLKIDPRAAAQEGNQVASELARQPINMRGVNAMQPELSMYANLPPMNFSELQAQQQALRKAAKAAYGAGGMEASPKAKIAQAINRGFGLNAADVLEKASPNAGKIYRKNAVDLGSLISAKPQVQSALNKPTISLSLGDLGVGALGFLAAGSQNEQPADRWKAALSAYLAKKGLGIAGNVGATYGGRAVNLLGRGLQQVPMSDALIRQAIIHNESPWSLMPQKQGD